MTGEPEQSPTGEILSETKRLLVFVANEPRAYRETLSAALRSLRPDAEVLNVEPLSLDLELTQRNPDLVLCSNHTLPAGRQIPAWVDLYPNGENLAIVVVRGRRSKFPDIRLADLLSIVDQARTPVNDSLCK